MKGKRGRKGEAGREGIYVFELANGHIKLGRSNDLAGRLRSHANNVDTYSTDVLNVWTCSVHDSFEAETLLKRMLIARPGCRPVTNGNEVWKGIPFAEVVVTALALLRDSRTFKLGDLPERTRSVFDDTNAALPIHDAGPHGTPSQAHQDASLIAFTVSCSVGQQGVPKRVIDEWLAHRESRVRLAALVKPRTMKLPRDGACQAYPVSALLEKLHELGWTMGELGFSSFEELQAEQPTTTAT